MSDLVVVIDNSDEPLLVAQDVADLEGMVGENVAGGPQPDCCGAGVLTLEVANPVAQQGRLVRYRVVCRDNDDPEYVEQGIKGCGAQRGLRMHPEHDTVWT